LPTLFIIGIIVLHLDRSAEALLAAEELKKQGVSAAVIDMFTIKPLDKELVAEYSKKTGAFVTADNHNVSGGLGDAVASALCETCPAPLRKLGINDEFGEVGSLQYPQDRFRLNAGGIIEKVNEVLHL
jgi:transketolase